MKVLFFLSHQPNPRFVKQINFLAFKNEVTIIHFKRKVLANLNDSISKDVLINDLGELPNASKPFLRLWIYIKLIGEIKRFIKQSTFDLTLVNNIDVLLLYILSYKNKKLDSKIAIEISDLRKFVFGNTIIHKIIRKVERRLYRKSVDKLIVTSEKYYSYHFEHFFKKEVFVLENKMLSNEIHRRDEKYEKISKKIIIGIVGLLLRKKEYIKLFETYKNSQEIEIHIHGKGEYQDLVKNYADKYDNITYFGPYNAFKDTQKIYQSIDIVYLVYDTDQVSLNNKLALPNKLYECMYYRVPILCSKDTYLAEYVLSLGIGNAINYKEEGAIHAGVKWIIKNREIMETKYDKIPETRYFGDEDYIKLEKFLNS
jgi:glycosyltransferase involved in cell wall biosynthesis